jgi:hypothetical protein
MHPGHHRQEISDNALQGLSLLHEFEFEGCGRHDESRCVQVKSIIYDHMHMQAQDHTLVHVNGSGAAVGIGEVLAGMPRLSTVTADTYVEAFYLSAKVAKAIMDSSDMVRFLFPAKRIEYPLLFISEYRRH